MKKERLNYTTLEVILLVIAATFMGVAIGFFIAKDIKINGKTLVGDPYLVDLLETYDNITGDYYKKADKEKILNGAMEGMLNSLDDEYASYFNKSENKSLNEYLSGNYLGIGVIVSITKDSKVYIDGVFKNTPADKAGLKIGDEIIGIDTKTINKDNLLTVISALKNDNIKNVNLDINRSSKALKFKIKKASIEVPSVSSKKINDEVGYIGINVFSKTTPSQVKDAMTKFKKSKIKNIIVDVRGNGGGYLNSLNGVMELFVTGKKCIYQTEDKSDKEKYYVTGKNKKKYNYYVLIDHNSASASELLAAGLRDVQDAVLVGQKSFGKGTVQKAVDMKSGGMYKYTIQNWLTSNGKSIDKIGVDPDVKIEMNHQNPGDEQLDEVLTIINKG